jgi:hypothetical protein
MTETVDRSQTTWQQLRSGSAALSATGALMLIVLAGAGVGLIVDPRTIGGVPAWLKPAKFAASIAIYTFTLAWIFTHLGEWRRTRRIVGAVTTVTLLLEMVIIVTQAARGTTSHFNVGTAFDAILWATMGLAIVVQTMTSIAVAYALWHQRFASAALGWALRLGMMMTIIGASTGGLMTQPTAAQLAEVRVTHRMAISGAHTIGGPDGGPGLPGTGWSVEHGDGRVAHFIGLHALQAMLLVFLVLSRRRLPEWAAVRFVALAAASYSGLFAILLWQGLRGQAFTAPDAATLWAVAIWLLGTVAAAWTVLSARDVAATRTVYR